ncbi:CaiB/BaiF CoA transferase family protein [Microbaculum marinisediminis]|uniref:CoA transferase n=1 Tax=Microbaculum marinisediminis TaxID=2931392 RepID=A0AAW5R5N0_9HYPH|nr:CoA transferase [Microbaculum sp. A6E488]MCT8973939.1 CoA transferase [Microbaculum sp. A6E488]
MLPLAGLRIVAVEQYGAGPFGTQHLADLGADVIKVENPALGGDVARSVGPHFLDGGESSASSLFFQSFNRNKRSIALDLSRAGGRRVFHDLVRTADAVACNNRGDVQDKLGLTYAHLGKVKQSIVCAHLTGYGREGERAAWPGYDYLLQAEAGYFAVTGEPGSPPARMGLSIVDFMAGAYLALAVVSGVHQARETGRGRDMDVTLFDTAVFNLNYLATWYLASGHNQGREPRSAHPSLTPCQLYMTKDGWIYLMCNKEKFWEELCGKIGRAEWAIDPRFAQFSDRLRNREALTGMLDDVLSEKTTAEWMAVFAGAVPAAPLNDVAQALDNPFVANRGRIQDLSQPGGGTFRMLASPIQCPGEAPPASPGPALGGDTEALLDELGYDSETRLRLLDTGVG